MAHKDRQRDPAASVIFPNANLSSAAMFNMILSTSSPVTGWWAFVGGFMVTLTASLRCEK
jgi:hypothetical protein